MLKNLKMCLAHASDNPGNMALSPSQGISSVHGQEVTLVSWAGPQRPPVGHSRSLHAWFPGGPHPVLKHLSQSNSWDVIFTLVESELIRGRYYVQPKRPLCWVWAVRLAIIFEKWGQKQRSAETQSTVPHIQAAVRVSPLRRGWCLGEESRAGSTVKPGRAVPADGGAEQSWTRVPLPHGAPSDHWTHKSITKMAKHKRPWRYRLREATVRAPRRLGESSPDQPAARKARSPSPAGNCHRSLPGAPLPQMSERISCHFWWMEVYLIWRVKWGDVFLT